MALVAGRQWEAVYRQALEFKPLAVVLFDETAAERLRSLISPIPVYSGMQGILRVIGETDFDYLVNAIVGAVGLLPTYHAIGKARRIALANKETLVMGGALIRQRNWPDHPPNCCRSIVNIAPFSSTLTGDGPGLRK